MSSSLSKKALWLSWFATPLVVGGLVVAAPFAGVPHPAVESQALSASAMNQNFEVVGQYVSALEARLAAIEAGPRHRVPAGTVLSFAGGDAQVPDGWLVCDGRELAAADYPELATVLLGTFGSATPGKFRLPDLRGRVVVGVGQGADLAQRALGERFGAQDHALSSAQLPPHVHAGTTGIANPGDFVVVHQAGNKYHGSHVTGYAEGGYDAVTQQVGPYGMHTHNFTTDDGPGTSEPFPLAQPSLVLSYLIKI